MGNKQTVFSEEQLENYADTTFLTKTEILRVFRLFCEAQETPPPKTLTYEDLTQIVVTYSELCQCPELKENPFRKRICKVFSEDDSGNLTFDEFLLLFSVFSERAPREMKVHYAFQIYDFDGDNFVGSSDIEHTVKLLTQNELALDEIESIWEKTRDQWITRDGKSGQPGQMPIQPSYKPARQVKAASFGTRYYRGLVNHWDKVLFEADIDDDKKLSASEFEHVITKSPDFITTFHFRI